MYTHYIYIHPACTRNSFPAKIAAIKNVIRFLRPDIVAFSLMAIYEFKPDTRTGAPAPPEEGLGNYFLYQNALWFIKIRTLVVCAFLGGGVASWTAPSFLNSYGFASRLTWPLVLGAILGILNMIFALIVQRLSENSPERLLRANVWLQIGVDLIFVTILVHLVGSVDSFIPFAYLFHIVLACIFFTRKGSITVLLIAFVLYLGCMLAENSGFLPEGGIRIDQSPLLAAQPAIRVFASLSAGVIWFITWYLVTHLASAVRERDRRLAQLNEQLQEANRVKNQWMLQTAHDLKAPLSGMETNIAHLRYSRWNELPQSGKELIEKIENRAKILRERIGEILFLGGLRSETVPTEAPEEATTEDVIRYALEDVTERAARRNISLQVIGASQTLFTRRRQIAALLANVLSNAINYSPEGSTVNIIVEPGDRKAVVIKIEDHGVGIDAKELPRIFDEYYKGKAARQIRSDSTGLGLAIVKEIALKNGIGVRVTSEPGQGTTFELSIPHAEEA